MFDKNRKTAVRSILALLATGTVFYGVQAQAADLAVVTNGPGAITTGSTVVFTLHPRNAGPLTLATGIVTTVTDVLPNLFSQVTVNAPGWNCGASSGLSVSCAWTAAVAANQILPVINVSAMANAPGNYVDCASISFVPNAGTQPDQVLGNNNSCVTGVITRKVELPHDVQLKKSGGGTVAVNGDVTFTLSTFNVGPGAIGPGDVTVKDPLMPGFTLVSVNATGWTCGPPQVTCTYNGSVAGGPNPFPPIILVLKATVPGNFTNHANVVLNHGLVDSNLGNNADSAGVIVTEGKQPHDVKLTERSLPGPFHVGAQIPFSLNPTNVGPGSVSAGQVTVTDTLPPGFALLVLGSGPDWSCTHAGNPVAISCTYVGTNVILGGQFFPQIALTTKPAMPGAFVNTAHMTYLPGPDSNPADNTATLAVPVAP